VPWHWAEERASLRVIQTPRVEAIFGRIVTNADCTGRGPGWRSKGTYLYKHFTCEIVLGSAATDGYVVFRVLHVTGRSTFVLARA
jgi:hypothetical protein